MRSFSSAFCSRCLRVRNVWLWPGAILALLLAAVPAEPADPVLSRLDARLQVLYQAQAEAQAKGLAPDADPRARALLGRLQQPGSRLAASASPRLSLLVKHRGDRQALAAGGFHIESCLGTICAGTLPLRRLSAFAARPEVEFVQSSSTLRAFAPVGPVARPSLAPAPRPRTQEADAPQGDLGGANVLVAFVDTGVDFRHQDFRNADGTTRIKALLDFSYPGDVDGDGDLDGPHAHGGTLYTEAQINTAIQSGSGVPQKDTTGHGTHGLSVAAGDDPTTPGVAPQADLLVVKATREDGSLGFVSADLVNALAWIDATAAALAKPCVINLSLGTVVGSHDGRSLEEQAIDVLTGPGRPGRVAVIAAGNSSDNYSSNGPNLRHFRGNALVGVPRTHTLEVPDYTPGPGQGDDRIVLDLWYSGADRLKVKVTSPNLISVVAPFGEYVDEETTDGNVFVANLGGANAENGDIESLVVIDDWAGTAPAEGTWTISIEAEQIGDDGEYHAWLADDSAVGGEAPRLFENSDNFFLVGKPGTALHGITVGSYAWAEAGTRYLTTWTDLHGTLRVDETAYEGDISEFSSPGGTRDGRLKPDLTAPGERVLGAVSADAYPGVAPSSVYRYHGFPQVDALILSNTANQGFGVLQGTSFSAPVVTGLVARILSEAPGLDAIQVRNILLNATTGDTFTGAVPNVLWGWGKVDRNVGTGALPPTLRIDTEALPSAVLNEPYQFALTASGGTPPYAWSITAGTLPAGLTMDAHGLVSGIPTAAGSFDVTVSVTDGAARSATRDLTLTVESGWTLEIVTAVLPPARLGKPYDAELEARGGIPPYVWSVGGSSSLPPGLTLDPAGRVQGTPTTIDRFDFTLQVTDASSGSAVRTVRIRVTQDSSELWDPLGLAETSVNKLSVDPADGQHLFASTHNAFDTSQDAVFETTDAGETWRPISINNGFNGSADYLAVSPTTSEPWAFRRYDGAQLPELFRYDPSAAAWVDTNACAAGHPVIDGLAIDTGGVVYAVGQTCTGTSGDVRRSTDQGATWTTVGSLCGGAFSSTHAPGSIAVAPSEASRLYATRAVVQSSVYTSFTCRSADGGANWETMPGSLNGFGYNYLDVQVSQTNAADVLRGVSESFNHFVERSADGGTTWDRYAVTGSMGNECCLRRSPADPAVVLYGTSMGLHKSEDHGATWTRLSVKGDSGLDVTSLAFDPDDPDVFYVGSPEGVFRTTDGGATWTLRSRGLVRRGLTGLAQSTSNPGDVLIGTTAGTPHISRTGGERWTSTGVGLSGFGVRYPVVSSADPNLFLIQADLTGLFRSNDRGVSWTQVTSTSTCTSCWAVQAVDADPFDANVIVIGISGNDLYRSTDRGATWAPVAPDLGTPRDLTFARGTQGEGRVYAAMGSQGIARSDNHGASWAIVYQDGFQDMRVVEPAPSDARRVLAASPSYAYYRDPSCDYPCGTEAAQWHRATTSPARPVLSLAVEWGDPLVAYAGVDHPGTAGSFGGIYKTTDGGQTWARVPGVLDAYDVVSVATHPTNPGTVLAATLEGGVFRSTNGGQTWTPLDRYATVGELVNVTVKHPSSSLLFAGTEGYGVQASTDGGRIFTSRSTGLTNLNVNAIAFEPDSATVMYAATDAGLFKSTNTGNNWTPTTVTGEVTDLATDNEGAARRIWGTIKGQGVAYSDNAGGSFTVHGSGLASLELTSLAVEIEGTARRIWGTTKGGDGVVFSNDFGATWQAASGTGLADRNLNDFTFESGAARRIWGTARRIWGTGDSGVFYSDNDGQTWSEMPLGLPPGVPITSISMDPNTNEAFLSLFSDREGGVYRGGNTTGVWKPFLEGLDELKVRRLTNDGSRSLGGNTYATTFYAATAGDGSYKSDVQSESGENPTVTTTALPGGTLHQAYTTTLGATGGTPPYTWSVPEGFLPPGLTLDPVAGEISGQPGMAGTFGFTVQAADAQERLARQALSISVSEPEPTGISGRVTDAATSSPLANVPVDVIDPNGQQVAWVLTDSSGDYVAGGLPAGTYYARTHSAEYINEIWNNVVCLLWCSPSTGTAIQVSAGVMTTGIDFALAVGGQISGTVTEAAGGTPLANISWIEVFDTAGNNVASGSTDALGVYTTHGGLPTGTYHVQTWISSDYVNEAWNNITCLNCGDTAGAPIAVTAGSITTGIDFALALGGRVSGTVTAAVGGAGLPNVEVQLRDATGRGVGLAHTNASGAYSLPFAVPTGAYYARTRNATGYVNEAWDDIPCPGCPGTTGTPIQVTAGFNRDDIHFALAQGGWISGTVTDATNSALLADIDVQVYDSLGSSVTGANTGASGAYTTEGLLAGTYYLRTVNTLGYVNRLYDDIPCLTCELTSGTPVTVTAGMASNANFALPKGGRISGTVIAAATGLPLPNVTVEVIDAAGDGVHSVVSDASGAYLTTVGLPTGTYYVRTTNSLGYFDETWDNVPCNGGCNYTSGTPIEVTAPSTTPNISFALERSGSIAGHITDETDGTPLAVNGWVWDDKGNTVRYFSSNASGDYSVSLPVGQYRVVAGHNAPNYVGEIHDGIQFAGWPGGGAGTPVTVTAEATTPVSFQLARAGTIQGTVTDAVTHSPLQGQEACIWHGWGYKCGTTLANGTYTITGLPAGEYPVFVKARSGYGMLYYSDGGAGVPSYGNFVPQDATRVAVTVGNPTEDIDFALLAGARIAGTVRDEATNPIPNVTVIAYSEFGQRLVGGTTDANGAYLIGGLGAGTYYVRTENAAGYANECLGGAACPVLQAADFYESMGSPDFIAGTPVVLAASGLASGVDFALAQGGRISGRLTNAQGQGIVGNLIVFDAARRKVARATADSSGNYLTPQGLPAGDYYVLAWSAQYIAEMYNDVTCLGCDPTAGAPVAVTSGQTTPNINFTLTGGGRIAGRVYDPTTGKGVPANVEVWNQSGVRLNPENPGGSGFPGGYMTSGLPAGTYYLRTDNWAGYLDEAYGGTPCTKACTPTGTPVQVTEGDVTWGIDFTLARGALVTGTVTNSAGDPMAGTQGQIYDTSGKFVTHWGTDPQGQYLSITSLPEGTYHTRTRNLSTYLDEVYSGQPCIESCNLASGSPIQVMSTTNIGGINFTLWPSLTISDASTPENAGPATFTVTLSHAISQPVTAQYATSDQTATVGSDYTATSGTLTFDPGDVSKPVVVPITNDTQGEADETFLLSLSAPSRAVLVDGTGFGTIGDDDDLPRALTVVAPTHGTISGDGISCGAGGADCSEMYPYGTEVMLAMNPLTGYELVAWTGDCTGGGVCALSMNADHSVGASLSLIQYTLTVSKEGPGRGHVGSVPAGIDCGSDCTEYYLPDTPVALTATPNMGSTFSGWSGACSADPCTVTMNQALSVAATFTLDPIEVVEPVAWTNEVGATSNGGTLTKVLSGQDGWDAGAASTKGIGSGDGYAEFTATALGFWMAGLSHGDTDTTYEDIDYAVFVRDNANAYVFEGGVNRGWLGLYAPGDTFRVEFAAGLVRYMVNGVTRYEHSATPTYPLRLDAALFTPGFSVSNGLLGGALVEISSVEAVVWTNKVGATSSGNTLTKLSSVEEGWNAGAASTKGLEFGDGYAEFTASALGFWMAGLSHGDTDVSYEDIDFAVYVRSNGNAYAFEGGVNRAWLGLYGPGDTFRVEIQGGSVRYRLNGVTRYQHAISPTYPLRLDTSLFSPGGSVSNATLVGALTEISPVEPVVWTNKVATTANANALAKLVTIEDGWNAGAASTKGLASGDGYAEFTASSLGFWMAGLSHGDIDVSFEDIDFAVYVRSNGNAYAFEGGVNRAWLGVYAPGDVFRIEIQGGTIRYRLNGVTKYEHSVSPTYPLRLDTSLFTPGVSIGAAVLAGQLIEAVPAQQVVWTNKLGTTSSGNTLTKPLLGSEGWNAGAASAKGLGSGDGYAEFTASSLAFWMAGLSHGDADTTYEDIDFAVYARSNGNAYVFENGVSRSWLGLYEPGDVFRVEIQEGIIRYRVNGVTRYEHPVAPTYPLLLDASVFTPGASVNNAILAGALVEISSVESVFWTNKVGASSSGNTLSKLESGQAGWDAGGASAKGIGSGDGYAEWTASSLGFWMAGLSYGDTDVSYEDIDFAVYVRDNGNAYVFEGGTNRGWLCTYVAGDSFRVEIQNGMIRYRVNGVTKLEHLVSPTYPLRLDTSLFTPGISVSEAVLGGALR